MEIKMSQALQVYNFLGTLAEQHLPLKVSYSLAKLKSQLEGEISFYNQRIQQYIDAYAQKDEHGAPITDERGVKIQEDKIQECGEKIQELSNLEIKIEGVNLPLSSLEEADLSFDQVNMLFPFITE